MTRLSVAKRNNPPTGGHKALPRKHYVGAGARECTTALPDFSF